MKKEFMTFTRDLADLKENEEISLTIRDLTPEQRKYKYDAKIVKAILSSSPDKLPDGDVLWVRSWTGVLHPKPWAIKVMADLGETQPGHPAAETTEHQELT